MNCYERIQKAIDYIEKNLEGDIILEKAAHEACFSLSHFYRMFHALTGHAVKEYIRKRRLSEAARRLVYSDDRLIDICFDYGFEYQESFTRAFKEMFGMPPGKYRKQEEPGRLFENLDLVDLYFSGAEDNMIDPKIKVLKMVEPLRVASCRVVSRTPENDAFDLIMEWADRHGLLDSSTPYRLFGFDNPGPEKGKKVYGYEFWITVESDFKETGPITMKEFPGGLYAVTGTTIGDISKAWKNFVIWLGVSRYSHGQHQCLEEHLSISGPPHEKTQIDLYLPLAETNTKKGGIE
jgi:AraC-like DNA-binding protein/DNA gyrase inhibitor GyrI